MHDLIKAIALLLIIEGMLYAVFPSLAKNIMRQIIDIPTEKLKTIGFFVVSIGLALLWAVR